MKLLRVMLACVALATTWGCDSVTLAPTETCLDVPDGGCPLSNGVACEDPTCQAVYACNAGVWSLDHTCPTIDAGTVDASADAPDAPAFDAASIDAPPGSFGGPGCPELEDPDCPLGEAIACGPGCCDCEELYVCVDMGWTDWGSCQDGGIVQN
jgi:hypothetical protein